MHMQLIGNLQLSQWEYPSRFDGENYALNQARNVSA